MSDRLVQLQAALADHYQIERELGTGGMAVVYLAQDLKHHRRVALKVLRAELSASLGSERFIREITIAAALSHPHILPLYDSGEATGFLYYVMPFVEGLSLRQKLIKERELPVTDAVRILRDMADAMAYAHEHGVVHRDIKPENVMLSGRHALVMDFGVAKAVSEATGRLTLTTAGVALGTPTYMAPEQAVADPHVDHRADIYAWGVVAYELLAGEPPFVRGTPQAMLAAHVTETARPVSQHRASIAPALATLVMRALEKRPADRWQSAEELVAQLETLLTPSGGMTPTTTQPLRGLRGLTSSRTRHWLWGTVAAAAAIAVTASAWYATTRTPPLVPGRVAVLPFENRTGDPALDDRGARLAEAAIEAIGREGVGEPVAWATIQTIGAPRGDPAAVARDVSRRTSAQFVVHGSYYKEPAGVEVRVELLRMPTAEQRFAFSATITGDPDSLGQLVTERTLVALTLEKEWGPEVSWQGEYLPKSMRAVREFLRSAELWARRDTTWYEAAREAYAADSAWIYALIQSIDAGLERTGSRSGWTAGRAALTAFERRNSLTQGDRERVSATRARLSGDLEGYYQATKRLFARRATEYGALLADASWNTLRLQEAGDLRPFLDTPGFWNKPERRRSSTGYFAVGYSLHLLGRFDEEAAFGRHTRSEFPELPVTGVTIEMRAAVGRGDVAQVRRLVDELELRGAEANAFTSRAWVAGLELEAHGHAREATEMYERAARTLGERLARSATTPGELRELGRAYWSLGRRDEVRRLLPSMPSGDSLANTYFAGALAARSGDRSGALQAIARLERMKPESPRDRAQALYSAAAVAALAGDASRAIELLREARAAGYNFPQNYHLNPDLASLRGTPAFEEFVRQRK